MNPTKQKAFFIKIAFLNSGEPFGKAGVDYFLLIYHNYSRRAINTTSHYTKSCLKGTGD